MVTFIRNSMENKKNLLFNYEQSLARQLAGRIIDKPAPDIWMIFIPILFVFHIWKVRQYSHAVNAFVENHLTSRRRALEIAFEALQNGNPPTIDLLVEKAGDIPSSAKPLYRKWLSLLVDHYTGLLVASGESHQELKRDCYRDKDSYLQFCHALNESEKAFNAALLPVIEGDQQDIHCILDRINENIAALRFREVEEIFGSAD
ncbi:MAG: NF038143 family protein [Proteobacteria bacterium]|nr:NF038143 family protein [Pseudomonadota bacterium]